MVEKAVAPHSSNLAWKIPWTEETGGLQSMGSLRVRHDWASSLSLFTFMHLRRKWQPTPVFLPGESQGWWEPGGLPSMGSHRVGHDWSDLAAAAALHGDYHMASFIVYFLLQLFASGFSVLTCVDFRKKLKSSSKCKEKGRSVDNPSTLLESTTGDILTCNLLSVSMAHCPVPFYTRDLNIWTLVSVGSW